jgi:hypothetical protein
VPGHDARVDGCGRVAGTALGGQPTRAPARSRGAAARARRATASTTARTSRHHVVPAPGAGLGPCGRRIIPRIRRRERAARGKAAASGARKRRAEDNEAGGRPPVHPALHRELRGRCHVGRTSSIERGGAPPST